MPTEEEMDTQIDRVFAEWEKTAPKAAAPVVLIEDAPTEADAALARESTDPEFANLLSCLAELADSLPEMSSAEVTITTGHGVTGPIRIEKGASIPVPKPVPAPAPFREKATPQTGPKATKKGRQLLRWLIPVVAIPILAAGVFGLLRNDVTQTPVTPPPPAMDLAPEKTVALPPPVENQRSPIQEQEIPVEKPEPPLQPPPPAAPTLKAGPLPSPSARQPDQTPSGIPKAMDAPAQIPEQTILPPPESPPPDSAIETVAPAARDTVRDETTVTQIPEPVSAALIPPQLIPGTRTSPVYPPMAMRTRAQGRVVLQVHVLKDGTVGDITVTEGPAPDIGFRKAAIQAVKTWRYRPALRSEVPVDMPITVVIDFRLN